MYIIYPLFNLKLCYKPSTDSLHPIIPNNACSLRITAAAGTKLAGTSSLVKVIILTNEKTLQPIFKFAFKNLFCFLHLLNITISSFRPLYKILHCWLIKLKPYLSFDVADHPLRPTKDHQLGTAIILPTT